MLFNSIGNIFNHLPPLETRKNYNVAAIVGFFFGAIGLGIYLSSFIDFAILLGLYFSIPFIIRYISYTVFNTSYFNFNMYLTISLLMSIYGYFRVYNSNSRLRK